MSEDFATAKGDDDVSRDSGFVTVITDEKGVTHTNNRREIPSNLYIATNNSLVIEIRSHHHKNPLIRGSFLEESKELLPKKAKIEEDVLIFQPAAVQEEVKAILLPHDDVIMQEKPLKMLEEEVKDVPIVRYRTEEILERAKMLPYSIYKDEYRVPPSDDIGGLPLVDQKVLETLRNVAREYLKQFFGRIFRGNFNLTTISFPIKCMRPLSVLETFAHGGAMNPLYLNKAALCTDPLERLKYVIVAQVATFYYTSNFLKPVFVNY